MFFVFFLRREERYTIHKHTTLCKIVIISSKLDKLNYLPYGTGTASTVYKCTGYRYLQIPIIKIAVFHKTLRNLLKNKTFQIFEYFFSIITVKKIKDLNFLLNLVSGVSFKYCIGWHTVLT